MAKAKQTVTTTTKKTITIKPKTASTGSKRCPNCGRFMKNS